MSAAIFTLALRTITGETQTLELYRGSVMLVVNVASKCGLTDQYEALESLYKAWHSRGFEVLGFPSNEFAGQEPGGDDEILAFCQGTFGVDFPMFSKIEVNGPGRHPLYRHLIAACPQAVNPQQSGFRQLLESKGLATGQPGDILWNFEKFLIGRDGEVVQRFSPDMNPQDPIILEAIKLALEK